MAGRGMDWIKTNKKWTKKYDCRPSDELKQYLQNEWTSQGAKRFPPPQLTNAQLKTLVQQLETECSHAAQGERDYAAGARAAGLSAAGKAKLFNLIAQYRDHHSVDQARLPR